MCDQPGVNLCDQYFVSNLSLLFSWFFDRLSVRKLMKKSSRQRQLVNVSTYFQGVRRQAATFVIISAISTSLCSTSAKVYISLKIFRSHLYISRWYTWSKNSSMLFCKQMLPFTADTPLLNLQCLPSFWVMTWNSVTILNRILIIVRDFHRFWYL